jgi:hypothetical protein
MLGQYQQHVHSQLASYTVAAIIWASFVQRLHGGKQALCMLHTWPLTIFRTHRPMTLQ